MQRFTDSSETATSSAATAEADFAPGPAEAGRRLDRARSSDREWRGALALRLHGRLAKLRKSDQLLQKCGVGLSGLMLVAAFAAPLWARGPQAGMNLFMPLILGALLCAVGSLGVIAGIGWCEDSLRSWLAQMGLTEEDARVVGEAGLSGEPWFCTACRTRNEASSGTCSGCACERRAEGSRLLSRVTEFENAAGNVVGVVLRVFIAVMVLGALIVALRGLAFAVSGP